MKRKKRNKKEKISPKMTMRLLLPRLGSFWLKALAQAVRNQLAAPSPALAQLALNQPVLSALSPLAPQAAAEIL